MDVTQARKLKEMEKENTQLKKLVADLSLDNAILKEVLSSIEGGLRQSDLTRQETQSGSSSYTSAGCILNAEPVRWWDSPDQPSDTINAQPMMKIA